MLYQTQFTQAPQLRLPVCFVIERLTMRVSPLKMSSVTQQPEPQHQVTLTFLHSNILYGQHSFMRNQACLFNGPQFSSVQFSRSVMSDSLRPHESQHARPPCPSPTSGVHSDSCSSSQRCHPAISSSVVPFSSCPQFLPASESLPMSQLFTSGGQGTGASVLASFLPNKSQG